MNRHGTEDALWRYNCEDVVRTLEVAEASRKIVHTRGLDGVDEFQHALFWPVLWAMDRGILIDQDARNKLTGELCEEIARREEYFAVVLGHRLNPRSPKQLQALFYEDLRQAKIISRATGNATLNEDALERIARREPILRPLVNRISEHRSLGVFLGTFVRAPLDPDGRLRTSLNICGTETYRFASSANAFGTGTNLQNIPKGSGASKDPDDLELPNIRRLFIPDPGCTFFDLDLDRADLQVVVWEADDKELKDVLRSGTDVHAQNAKTLGISRQLAKSWVHGTNYGGGPRTMATACGITVHQAETMRERWFSSHPGIKRWHLRVDDQLRTRRYVENKFGYQRFYFERVEGLLPEALAWIPQSTVACTINRIWLNLWNNLTQVETLLQCHDSLVGQFPTNQKDLACKILENSKVTIPYDDPLVIPCGLKISNRSWGDCENFSPPSPSSTPMGV